jgi:Fe-coproporphyrin III synthase
MTNMASLNIGQSGRIFNIVRTPRVVDVEITSKCNLICKYCYYFNNEEVNYIDLSKDEWLQFFDELGKLAVMNVRITGGEPFIRKDLQEIIEGIVRNRMRFSILSNGSLISTEMAAFLAKTGRCNFVQVSIDGSTSEIHDSFRGEGSFEGAIRGIRTLQKHRVPVTVRVTIHRNNVYDLENIARFLLEDLKIDRFSTNSAGTFGSCNQNAKEVLLSTQERMVAMETLLRLSEIYEGRIIASAGPLAEMRNWSTMEKARLQRDLPFKEGGHLTSCGCANTGLSVRSDGIMTPCLLLQHIELGRINKDSLSEVWLNSRQLKALRNRRSIPLKNFYFCSECPYIPYCTGNCPAHAYNLTGHVNHPCPNACLRSFLADGGKIPTMEH